MFENLNIEAPMAAEKCYEKAIEGYQFQVNRYHTWMNYYSVFVGAFFVALYTVWDKGDTVQSACCKCCKVVASTPASDNFWPYLLIALGLIASVCWLASLIGHRAWMGSWLRIVKMWEKKVLSPDDFVYQKVIIVKDVEKEKNSFCGTKEFVSGYISTQQMTEWFICVVIAAWILTGCYLYFGERLCWGIGIIGCLISSLIIRRILKRGRCCLISDNVKGMVKKQDPETENIQ